jgi:hypothetical protein
MFAPPDLQEKPTKRAEGSDEDGGSPANIAASGASN